MVIILVCAGGAYSYRYLRYARPVGKGPAGPSVPADRFEDVLNTWTTRDVLLLGIGDDMIAGTGELPGTGFFDRLIANPKNDFPEMHDKTLSKVLPSLVYRKLAEPGATSLECLESQVSKIGIQDDEVFGVVVVAIGTAEIFRDYGRSPAKEGAMYGVTRDQAQPWVENFTTRLNRILDEIESKFHRDGCQFFIADIYDPTDGSGDFENAGLPAWPDGLKIIEAYNGVIAAAAGNHKNVEIVKVHDAFLGHGLHCVQFWRPHYDSKDPHYWYGERMGIPNNRGHDALRRLFLAEMAQSLPALLEDGD